jgi:hypothetical protein
MVFPMTTSNKADKRFGKIPLWVAGLGLSGCEYGVLIVLANHANEKRLAWPSRNTIAKHVKTTVRKVSLALKKLEARATDAGVRVLRRHQRRTEHGDYDSTLYELFPDGMGVGPYRALPRARGGTTVGPVEALPGRALQGPLTEKEGTDNLTEESEAAREGERDVFDKNEGDSFGRSAPLRNPNVVQFSDSAGPKLKAQKKELRRQKVMRYVKATHTGGALNTRLMGLTGCDPVRDEQWWFDKCDAERKLANWDDVRDRQSSVAERSLIR